MCIIRGSYFEYKFLMQITVEYEEVFKIVLSLYNKQNLIAKQ